MQKALPLKNKNKKIVSAHLLIPITIIISVLYSNVLKDGVLSGIRLCTLTVIPSLFPFFILSDVLVSSGSLSYGIGSRLFSRIFGLPLGSFSVFLIGSVSGAPIGAEVSSRLYESGALDKRSAERLIAMSTNPSLAFVISGVGAGMLGSVSDGIKLYLTIMTATVITGLIFRSRRSVIEISGVIQRQKFDLTNSIKKAAYTSIAVSSYIIFFSSVNSLIKALPINEYVDLALISLTEMSSAVEYINRAITLPDGMYFPITAAVLAYSGLSVHLQVANTKCRELSFAGYFFMKFFEAVLSFIIAYAVFVLPRRLNI